MPIGHVVKPVSDCVCMHGLVCCVQPLSVIYTRPWHIIAHNTVADYMCVHQHGYNMEAQDDCFDLTKPINCCIHISNEEKGKVVASKETSWAKFVSCCFRWLNFKDTLEGEVAKKCVQQFDLSENSPVHNAGYHRGCYRRFCNAGRFDK